MRKTELLKRLQDVDTALDRARESLTRTIEALKDQQDLERTTQEKERLTRERQRLQAEQLDLELDVERRRQKVKALEHKLYGGKVTSPKELQNLSAEIEQERRLISLSEDRLLDCYTRAEETSQALAEAERVYQETYARWKERQEGLLTQRTALEDQIRGLEQERETLRAQVDPAALRTYDSLRRSKGGLAVAIIQQRTCQGCRISIPVNIEMKARSSHEPVPCPSCGRILYASI